MNKWDYIELISMADNHHGNYLIELMDKYDYENTQQITLKQAHDFWIELKKRLQDEENRNIKKNIGY